MTEISGNEIRVIRHAAETLKSLNRSRKEGLLCDVTIVVGKETYLAHRYLLAVSSEYFRNLFSEDKKEEVVTIEDTEPNIVKQCIEFIYTGTANVTDENVCPLWEACSKLQLPDIAERCANYLVAAMTGKRCLFARELAIKHGHERLKKAAEEFGLEHFADISVENEFLKLNKTDVLFFLKAPRNIDLPSTVAYFAIINWIHHDFMCRSNEFPVLLQYIDISRLSNPFLLQTIRNEPLFSIFDESRSLLENELVSRISKRDLCPAVILFDSSVCTTKAYNINTHRVCKMRGLEKNMYENCTALCLEEFIYVLKGDETYRLNCTHKMGVWSRIANLSCTRISKIEAGVLKHHIYVTGGKIECDGATVSPSAEYYHPSKNVWLSMRNMPTARYGHVVVGCGDFLYCIGGRGKENIILDTMDKFDPSMGVWFSENSPLNRPRADATAVSHCGRIYVLGGEIQPGKITNSVEYYVPTVGTWTIIARMVLPRSIFSAAIFEDKLFAIGGMEEQQDKGTVSIETMNLDNNTWTLHGIVRGIGKLEAAVAKMI
uniref:kelch-like protein 12 n=1 Tax=Styela clava TaxID=7725 RepID=UPI00193AC5D0|nr:kelch-like protein 12 [Styela clava]